MGAFLVMRLSSDQRALLHHPAGWIACGFGSGLSPVAPGTAGSLLALLPWLLLRELPPAYYVLALVLAFGLGVGVCHWAVTALRVKDPATVVWDEFVGLWIALMPLLWLARGWMWIFAGFILFRIFDIWKPWPVSWADRHVAGGMGVMLDDVIAGFYAAIVLVLLLRLI
jgi:phosphatidylglycerophosphatase A